MCFDQRDNVGELGRVGKGVVHCREIVSDESVEETRFECNVVHVSEGVEGCHWNNLGFVTVNGVFCCLCCDVGFGF